MLAAFASMLWYVGFVPVLDGPERADVRHALNLKLLPFGITINATGAESWNDYIFQADLLIDPQQFDHL